MIATTTVTTSKTRKWTYGEDTHRMGKINAIDGQWDVYGCTHFYDRSNDSEFYS